MTDFYAELGSKLAAMPLGARRLMPVVAGLSVTTIESKMSASDKNGAARRASASCSFHGVRVWHAEAAAAGV